MIYLKVFIYVKYNLTNQNHDINNNKKLSVIGYFNFGSQNNFRTKKNNPINTNEQFINI